MSATNLPKGWVSEKIMRQAVWPENPQLISSVALRVQCRRGLFPHMKFSNRYFFRIADVVEFLRRQSVSVDAATAARLPRIRNEPQEKTQ
jgi:hypothetical protein